MKSKTVLRRARRKKDQAIQKGKKKNQLVMSIFSLVQMKDYVWLQVVAPGTATFPWLKQ